MIKGIVNIVQHYGRHLKLCFKKEAANLSRHRA